MNQNIFPCAFIFFITVTTIYLTSIILRNYPRYQKYKIIYVLSANSFVKINLYSSRG